MKKIINSKFLVVILIGISILVIHNNVLAKATIDDVIGDAESFASAGAGSSAINPVDGVALQETSTTIYNIFLGLAIVVAVCVGAYLGIQFMMASAMDKAKYKEAMLPFILGCVVAFGAFGIWKIFTTMLNPLS